MLPWGGGGGGAGTTVSSSDFFCLCPFALVFTVFFALSHFFFVHHLRFPLVFTVFSGFMTLLMLRCTLGWGGVGWGNHVHVKLITLLRLHHVADATGGDVNVPCNLLTLLMLRHAGVGGDVNVPCNLLTLLMLRHARVGGMLTFHVTCSRC